MVDDDPFADVLGTVLSPPAAILFAAANKSAGAPKADPARRHVGRERRGAPRSPVAVDALVRPVDRDLNPTGPAFRAVVADISAEGLCLLHDGEISDDFLAVRFDDGWSRPTILAFYVARIAARQGFTEYAGPIFLCADAPEPEHAATLG